MDKRPSQSHWLNIVIVIASNASQTKEIAARSGNWKIAPKVAHCLTKRRKKIQTITVIDFIQYTTAFIGCIHIFYSFQNDFPRLRKQARVSMYRRRQSPI